MAQVIKKAADYIPSLSPTPTPIERLVRPFQRFIEMESAGGVALLVATAIALIWANSPWADAYHHIWEVPIEVAVGDWDLEMSLHHLINDGFMVVFFFLVGLEIKREVLIGELASMRAAALPIAGALGGMLVPAIIYTSLNGGTVAARGWGIPMATDIAFALGVLALVAPRAPVSLKVFLAALAIVDDLGAVLVIALFYTATLNTYALLAAAGVLTLLVLSNQLGVRSPGPYAALGVLLWLAVLFSGVHATIAGVLLAMTVPARTRINSADFSLSARALVDEFDRAGVESRDVKTNAGQQWAIQKLEVTCAHVQAPLIQMEHHLQPWVIFGIIPIFALANAGVAVTGEVGAALTNSVTLGVIAGLVLGKPLGIMLFSWAAVQTRLAVLPLGVRWSALHAISWLGGIGFTMSLFVAGLAFGEGSTLLDASKLGVLSASALAVIGGSILLRRAGFGRR